jgi:hypothetical protein
MTIVTPYSVSQAATLLREEMDEWPGFWECVLTLNARYWRGTSPVCGRVDDAGFRMRNRAGPGFSSEAVGVFRSHPTGTAIEISFREPFLASAYEWLLRRRSNDHEVILGFLRQTLRTARANATSPVADEDEDANR